MNKPRVTQLVWILVLVGGVVAVAGLLSEQGFRVVRIEQPVKQTEAVGFTPGDQRVERPAGKRVTSKGKGQIDAERGRQGKRKGLASASDTASPTIGESKDIRQQAKKHTQGQIKDKGQGPIPFIVYGEEKPALVIEEINQALDPINIASLGGVRSGWPIIDILRTYGVETASKVVFTARSGEKWSIDSSQIADLETRFVVTSGKKGQLLLLSGPEVENTIGIDFSKKRVGRGSKEMLNSLIGDRTDLISFPNIVRIEVVG